jgi:hypothetical protein
MNKPTTPFTPMTEGQAMLQEIVNGWIRQSIQNGKTGS